MAREASDATASRVFHFVCLTLGTQHTQSSQQHALAAAQSLVHGASVIVLPGIATHAECKTLSDAASLLVREAHHASAADAASPLPTMVRLPAVRPGTRSASPPFADPCSTAALTDSEDVLSHALFARVLRRLDGQFPTLVSSLFGDGSLGGMHAADELAFSVNNGLSEPAVNVYGKGGLFNVHSDGEALTVLIALSDPAEFAGGGTGFWAPPRWRSRWSDFHEGTSDEMLEAPRLVLRPPRGSVLLFGGCVQHAGMAVDSGTRCMLVGSFSHRRFKPRLGVGEMGVSRKIM